MILCYWSAPIICGCIQKARDLHLGLMQCQRQKRFCRITSMVYSVGLHGRSFSSQKVRLQCS